MRKALPWTPSQPSRAILPRKPRRFSRTPALPGMHALQQDQSQPQTGRIVDILAQASAIEEVASVEPDPETASSADQTAPAGSDARTTSPEDADSSASNSAPQPDSTAASAERELVFVDGNVADYEQLIADLQGSDGQPDHRSGGAGFRPQRDRAGQRNPLRPLGPPAVHFITHGADGKINLGNTWLTAPPSSRTAKSSRSGATP